MSETLDLGGIFAVADISTTSFDRKYPILVRQIAELATKAEAASGGFVALDDGLVGVGEAATKASAGLGRASKATTENATAAQKAVQVAIRHAEAMAQVNRTLLANADESKAVQRATLQLIAAQDRLTRAQEGGRASAAQLAAAQSSVIGAEERLAAVQREAAASTAGLAGAQREAAVASRGLTGGLGGTLKMAGELGLLFGGLELAKKALEFVGAGKELTTALNGVQAASRATDEQMKSVRAEAIGLGKDLTVPGATAVDAADAILDLVKAGLQLPKAMQAARPALLLAAATNTGMADTARVLGDTLDLFSLSGDHAAHVANILAASALGASHDLLGLFDALKQSAPTAQALGISIDDTAAALTLLAKHGISAQMGGAGLKTMLTSLAKDTPKTNKALQDLGVTAFDAQGKFVGFPSLFGQLHTGMVKMGPDSKRFLGDLNAAFGVRSQSVAALFAKEGTGAYEAVLKRLESGDLQKFANTTNRGVAATFRQLSKQATAAGIDVYDGVAPNLNRVLQLISQGVPAAISIGKAALAPFALAWHLVNPALSVAADVLHVLESVLGAVGPEIKVVAIAAAALWAGMKAGQLVGAILTGIGSGFETMQLKAMYAQDAVAAGWARMGGAASAAATETGAAATTIAAESEAASETVVASGEAAEVGWAGLAGPLGAAALGIFAIVSLFHHSATASKEATDSAKAYADALASGGKSNLVDTIRNQLKDNGLSAELAKINAGLGRTAFTGKQFIDAIAAGNPVLGTLRTRLQAVIDTGTSKLQTRGGYVYTLTPTAKAATEALKHLNTQYDVLTKTAAKDLLNTKTFAGAAGAIQKTATATRLGTQAAQQYAVMAGLEVDKNGIVAQSQDVVSAAVARVAHAYDTATTSGSELLAGLDSFAKSAGNATDRAAIISAILKANAGDALAYASTMNAAATATAQLHTDIASAAKGAKEGTGAYLRSIVNLHTGTIRYNKTAAAPLISNLQSIQTSALNAASGTYQHELATLGASRASADAVTQYKGVEDSLVNQLHKLGLTKQAAQDLTNKYLGVPDHVKTLIEQAGANPVVDVLNRIGKLLANLTGQTWDVPVNVIVSKIVSNVGAGSGHGAGQRTAVAQAVGTAAAFGQKTIPPNTRFTVGEGAPHTWEGGVSDSQGRVSIFSNAQSKAMGFRAPVAYASGTSGNYAAIASLLSSLGATRAGIAGFLGNTKIESGGRLNAIGGPAHGLQQWQDGRYQQLVHLASKMRESWKSRDVQLAMIRKELTGAYKGTLRNLQHATRSRAAAAYVDQHYEGSDGSARGAREAAAVAFAHQLATGKLAATGTGGKTGLTQVANSSAALNAYNALGKLARAGRDGTKQTDPSAVLADLRRTEAALAKAGASAGFVARITKQNAHIVALAKSRNTAAAHLAAATKAVADATNVRSQDYAAFKGAGVGSFDITSAGVGDNGRVTAGSLRSSQGQALTRIRAWATGMKKLIASKVFPAAYLRSLLGAGPASLPTVQALLGMSAADMKTFAANERTIDTISGQVASAGAHKLDDPAINKAKTDAATAAATEARYQQRLETAVNAVGQRVADELSHLNVQSKLHYKNGELYVAVETDKRRARHRKATTK